MESRNKLARRLVLIELNEVNFDLVHRYAAEGTLPSFKRLLSRDLRRTTSEASYEKLEPWIQWVSAHSGLTAQEHGIFRLGDIVGSKVPQVFEELEAQGWRVGCISPMNAENRLRAPAYFLPDPWTRTASDGSFWSRVLAKAVGQVVNDNAKQRISASSALALLGGLLRFARSRHYGLYLRLLAGSRGRPWRKALCLDLLLHDLHLLLLQRARPHFSTLFVNAGAHIQHHYLFNARLERQGPRNPDWYAAADIDPFGEMLEVYDRILAEYLDQPDFDVIIATGLTQQPYDRVKYYYRLRQHAEFMRLFGVPCVDVEPRMTRDFLVRFATPELARQGQQRLASAKHMASGRPIFGDIDYRGESVFASLVYPDEIGPGFIVEHEAGRLDLHPHVAFVAIKNGMHLGEGFAYFGGAVAAHAPPDGAHVSRLYHTIKDYFAAAVPA